MNFLHEITRKPWLTPPPGSAIDAHDGSAFALPTVTVQRVTTITALAAMAAAFLAGIAHLTFLDPDMLHGMALIRESLRIGHLPLADGFAYTPTVYPVVHHEWAAGARRTVRPATTRSTPSDMSAHSPTANGANMEKRPNASSATPRSSDHRRTASPSAVNMTQSSGG